MITTYSLAKHGNERVSEDFRVYEFRCKDGSDAVKISSQTVEKLQAARNYFGKPVHINSAYRTAAYNASPAVNGARNSQHIVGTACDIWIEGVPPEAIAAFFEARFPTSGIGLYESFVHIDSRGSRTYWDQRSGKQIGVTSFKLGKMYEQYKPKSERDDLEMTVPEIKRTLLADADFCRGVTEKYISELVNKPVSEWAKEEFERAKALGITDGTNPQMFCTREQVASMIVRTIK